MQDYTQHPKSFCNLPERLCINICSCILEEVLDKLFILQRINTFPKMRRKGFSNKDILVENMEKINKDTAHRVKCSLATFHENFNFIETTLKSAYDELKSKGTYETLLEVIKTFSENRAKAENLKEETIRKHHELEKLQHTVYEQERYYHSKITECMADIGKVKDEIEDFLVESELKMDYIEKWQNSKIEMNKILMERKEEEKMSELKQIDANIYKEARIHQEILAAYNEIQKDFLSEIDKWEEKYNKNLAELEENMQLLKEKREKQSEATKALKETYLKRQKEINDYKLYKIREEEKKMELKTRNDAATKIQAWWRGTMVRKGFGKFRKKKDKKGKKKGSEKQEKK